MYANHAAPLLFSLADLQIYFLSPYFVSYLKHNKDVNPNQYQAGIKHFIVDLLGVQQVIDFQWYRVWCTGSDF